MSIFWLTPGEREKKVTTPPVGSSGARPTAPRGKQIYTVVQGDSLWKIANRHFGDGKKWNSIYEANRDKIRDPDVLYPGQVLTIPRA